MQFRFHGECALVGLDDVAHDGQAQAGPFAGLFGGEERFKNSLAMGLVRAIVLRYWGWDGWHFFAVAPLLLFSGLFVPVAAQRLLFSRWNWTDRITR